MSECYIGEIILVPYFRGAPEGWLVCDGSTQSIATYDALFTLLGTTYGGDGVNTFGLPDLRSRVPVHAGSASGLQTYIRGQTGGTEQVSLTSGQLPPHTHQMSAAGGQGSSNTPTSGGALASASVSNPVALVYAAPGGSQVALAGVGTSGNSTPHNNIQPSLALNYIICWAGVFPSQAG